jgi:phage shock protein PspC (stress-responsive transcriptional regulator)
LRYTLAIGKLRSIATIINMKKKLYRSSRGKVIAGVCAGLGEYFEIDPVLIRALFIIALFSGGIGVTLYFVLWIIMPSEETVFSSHPPTEPSELSETDDSILSEKHKGTVLTGLVLVGLGMFFLIREFFPMFSFKYMLPIVLIAIGVVIVFNALRKNLTSSKP